MFPTLKREHILDSFAGAAGETYVLEEEYVWPTRVRLKDHRDPTPLGRDNVRAADWYTGSPPIAMRPASGAPGLRSIAGSSPYRIRQVQGGPARTRHERDPVNDTDRPKALMKAVDFNVGT